MRALGKYRLWCLYIFLAQNIISYKVLPRIINADNNNVSRTAMVFSSKPIQRRVGRRARRRRHRFDFDELSTEQNRSHVGSVSTLTTRPCFGDELGLHAHFTNLNRYLSRLIDRN